MPRPQVGVSSRFAPRDRSNKRPEGSPIAKLKSCEIPCTRVGRCLMRRPPTLGKKSNGGDVGLVKPAPAQNSQKTSPRPSRGRKGILVERRPWCPRIGANLRMTALRESAQFKMKRAPHGLSRCGKGTAKPTFRPWLTPASTTWGSSKCARGWLCLPLPWASVLQGLRYAMSRRSTTAKMAHSIDWATRGDTCAGTIAAKESLCPCG